MTSGYAYRAQIEMRMNIETRLQERLGTSQITKLDMVSTEVSCATEVSWAE